MRILLVLIGAAVIFAVRSLRRYQIDHRSMTPTLQPGDYVVAARTRRPKRGDVVVTAHPTRAGLELVKRVVGLPHEHIAITEEQIEIDGRTYRDVWAIGTTAPQGSWQVGDALFVLGDQRELSVDDSRMLGPIPMSRDVWRVRFRYWPPTRIGTIAADP